ncbi:hypothetical protein EST38_g4007 [Candolleomyces aberdarensis]|uniref:Uncharacterized protein n=1 Tax=Candolleomyces aberdarensis TaxID=2316362 RepID=A0A4V1Q4F0_9AGAR|nr:hypothetical protein EST38_g4007 [Candolleomyces aberdarensis]
MWDTFDSGQYSIGMDDPEQLRQEKLCDFERRVQEYNLWARVEENVPDVGNIDAIERLDEQEHEEALSSILEATASYSETEKLAHLYRQAGLATDENWSPYPSKLLFLLDAIDNMPRLRVSAGLMNIILWLLREAGDWMNPHVRPHIRRYPCLPKDGVVSEIWHGEKWRRTQDRHALSPMYDGGQRHYYIDEPAKTKSGELVIPIRWLEDEDGKVWFEAWRVTYDVANLATICDSENELILLEASVLKENMLDLEERGLIPTWSEATVAAGHTQRMPNPDRALAEGEALYVSYIDIFGDDISGNRSKSWNKHWNIYITHRNLPRELLQKESHTHFTSTSPHASVPEQFQDAIYNPFLTLKYCDITQDTPVEILHTVLLGVVKYSWHGTHTTWKDAEKSLYAACLQSTNTKGLSIPAIRAGYIMQYANSLIGRQLKILVQTNAFHVHDMVTEDQYQLIKATGVLAALLWVPEIRDMDEYLNDVDIAVANVLDSAALIDPSKIIAKVKYHVLTHAVEDIRRFGPLIGVATESYESFNIIFRHCSILSNHLSPSRDIAYQLAKQETFKHLISGGWWKEEDGKYKQPGVSLQRYVGESAMLQQLYNISHRLGVKDPVGHTVLIPVPRKDPATGQANARHSYRFEETEARDALTNSVELKRPELAWFKCKSIVANSGDECRVGSWVFICGLDQNSVTTLAGRVLEILRVEGGAYSFAVVEHFQVAQALHPKFDMPVLVKPFNKTTKVAVAAKDILFDFNAQHDCYTAKCVDSGTRALTQEQVDSGNIKKYVEHQPIDRYVINTHAFHNAHRLRSVPGLHEYLRPKLLNPDRRQFHQEAASALRQSKVAVVETAPDAMTGPATQPPSVPTARPSTKSSKKRKHNNTAQPAIFTVLPPRVVSSQSGEPVAGPLSMPAPMEIGLDYLP